MAQETTEDRALQQPWQVRICYDVMAQNVDNIHWVYIKGGNEEAAGVVNYMKNHNGACVTADGINYQDHKYCIFTLGHEDDTPYLNIENIKYDNTKILVIAPWIPYHKWTKQSNYTWNIMIVNKDNTYKWYTRGITQDTLTEDIQL